MNTAEKIKNEFGCEPKELGHKYNDNFYTNGMVGFFNYWFDVKGEDFADGTHRVSSEDELEEMNKELEEKHGFMDGSIHVKTDQLADNELSNDADKIGVTPEEFFDTVWADKYK